MMLLLTLGMLAVLPSCDAVKSRAKKMRRKVVPPPTAEKGVQWNQINGEWYKRKIGSNIKKHSFTNGTWEKKSFRYKNSKTGEEYTHTSHCVNSPCGLGQWLKKRDKGKSTNILVLRPSVINNMEEETECGSCKKLFCSTCSIEWRKRLPEPLVNDRHIEVCHGCYIKHFMRPHCESTECVKRTKVYTKTGSPMLDEIKQKNTIRCDGCQKFYCVPCYETWTAKSTHPAYKPNTCYKCFADEDPLSKKYGVFRLFSSNGSHPLQDPRTRKKCDDLDLKMILKYVMQNPMYANFINYYDMRVMKSTTKNLDENQKYLAKLLKVVLPPTHQNRGRNPTVHEFMKSCLDPKFWLLRYFQINDKKDTVKYITGDCSRRERHVFEVIKELASGKFPTKRRRLAVMERLLHQIEN